MITATIELKTNSDNVGLVFRRESEVIDWNDLTSSDQIKIINSLERFQLLFTKFLKQ